MACEYTTRKDLGLVALRFSGWVTAAEFVDVLGSLQARPPEPGTVVLADLRGVGRLSLTLKALTSLTAPVAEPKTRLRIAMIAPSDEVFRICRMFAALVPAQVRVFRSTQAAAEGTGLAPALVEEALASGRRPVRLAEPTVTRLRLVGAA